MKSFRDLEKLARAATPGPRHCIGDGVPRGDGKRGILLVVCNASGVVDWGALQADRALCAAVTPELLIDLLQRVRDAEATERAALDRLNEIQALRDGELDVARSLALGSSQ